MGDPLDTPSAKAPTSVTGLHGVSPWTWVVASFGIIGVILIAVLRHGQAAAFGGLTTTDTGGRVAVVALGFVGVLPLFVTQVSIRVPRWLAWIAGAMSVVVITVFWLLIRLGMDGAAWAAYGGMQVLRARMLFSDLNWVVQAIHCDFCVRWEQNHGPGIILGRWLTFGQLSPSWVNPLGFLMLVTCAGALVWLARVAPGRGVLVLLIASISPAWLLLLERGNLDGVVFSILVLGAWLVRRRDSLWSWGIFAVLIFAVGTVKYYPFVLGVALLPAVRLRRGWAVIAAFLLGMVVYLALFWDSLLRTARFNSDSMAVLYDFPAYGRVMVLDRMGETDRGLLTGGTILMVLLVLAGVVWGVQWGKNLRLTSYTYPILAAGGSALFLTAILVGGFGYMYKGAFLLPMVPLLALPLVTRKVDPRFTLYTSLVALLCVTLALTIAYSSLLATLAGLLSASIALGAACYLLWRILVMHARP